MVGCVIEFGFLTFPFGLNLFISMGITGKSLTRIGKAVLLILMLFGLLLIAYMPGISLWVPALLMP